MTTGVMTANSAFLKLEVPCENPKPKKRRYKFNAEATVSRAQENLKNAIYMKNRIASREVQDIAHVATNQVFITNLIKTILTNSYIDRTGNHLELVYKNQEIKSKLEKINNLIKKNKALVKCCEISSFLSLSIQNNNSNRTIEAGFGISKIFAKASLLAKLLSKTTEKTALKYLPYAGLSIGFSSAIFRFYNGEQIKAVVEVASGILTCFPFYGTAAALVLDGALILHDASTPKPVVKKLDASAIAQAKRVFDIKPSKELTKKLVRSEFRNTSKAFHPDNYVDMPALQNRMKKIQNELEKTKTILLTHLDN